MDNKLLPKGMCSVTTPLSGTVCHLTVCHLCLTHIPNLKCLRLPATKKWKAMPNVTRRLYCVEWTQYSICPKRSAICNRCFPGPTRVVDANDISIATAVFAGLTRWQTDWQTDRPRYSVGNNRQSAQRRSQILLLSTATTSYNKYLLEQSIQIHNVCLSFVSVNQMAPPVTEVGDIQLHLSTHVSTRRNERLSWPGWLTYSGRFTHISGHPSATGLALDRESSPAKDRRSTAVPRNQLRYSLIITRCLYCVECPQYSIRIECFLGPNRVFNANGILIASAVFAQLNSVTDLQTICYAVSKT